MNKNEQKWAIMGYNGLKIFEVGKIRKNWESNEPSMVRTSRTARQDTPTPSARVAQVHDGANAAGCGQRSLSAWTITESEPKTKRFFQLTRLNVDIITC